MKLLETILNEIEDVKVLDAAIDYKRYISLDLSDTNQDLKNLKIDNASDFENYIENYLKQNDAKVAYGGYNEVRNLYKRSTIFNDSGSDERNIHIGLDLWIKAGTPVLAAIDGFIHSYNNNLGVGDYGPTIILEHRIQDHIFYTLYGHLSLESIAAIKVGTAVKKAEQIASLGDASVNGDYSPHLHFQIIKEIPTLFGDYPGVCSKKDQEFYLKNCPDPNVLLKIK
ncbi:murein DD-endopeptidase MepM/ murein hydrolase activator NlpD [Flavobacterium sp. PL11]|jgi:murein DD-endopeptidase MepM/ murein hydrolase activator NlpD|uniref:peptidoglycan DD-metalloendopeptidase family protein n=1 Tax=Flavobacterium sp. PL11 TaxID=3071717 RepID=UPI002DF90F21|nr:murein DD-endopeptidase MepM/ murein hydrolase activator NlpD [Flavobacterium sp. PL11]